MPQRFLHPAKMLTLLALVLPLRIALAGDILVQVEGRQGDAPVHLALLSADQPDWNRRILRQISSPDAELRLRNLPPGRYAIQLFQDLDGDGQLALSPRGLPREPVGFSANPPLTAGKPTPLRCLFEHGSGDTRIRVKLRSRR